MWSRISSFSVSVHVSEAYVTTGLMRVRYIHILCFFFISSFVSYINPLSYFDSYKVVIRVTIYQRLYRIHYDTDIHRVNKTGKV
jgi:hypothetical protein